MPRFPVRRWRGGTGTRARPRTSGLGPDGEPLDRTELGAVDARGSVHLTPPLPAGYLKATLLLDGTPVDGEEPGAVPFSISPNLLANPSLIPDLSGEPRKLSVPGWNNPTVLPVTLTGGPTPEGTKAVDIELGGGDSTRFAEIALQAFDREWHTSCPPTKV